MFTAFWLFRPNRHSQGDFSHFIGRNRFIFAKFLAFYNHNVMRYLICVQIINNFEAVSFIFKNNLIDIGRNIG
jgi:hypothetical protein